MSGNRKRADFEAVTGHGRRGAIKDEPPQQPTMSATRLTHAGASVAVWALIAALFTTISGGPVAAQGPTCNGQPATIVGTALGETINGTNGDDVIFGGPGNDRIFGKGGNDVICGGLGSNFADGGAGRDVILGGPVRDVLRGGPGNDLVRGGLGNDHLRGDGGSDRLFGGNGNDYAHGGDGADRVNGGNGADLLHGGAGNDVLAGNKGKDRVYGDLDADRLFGGDDNDYVNGGQGNDVLRGGSDNDRLVGWTGTDRLFGDAGNDVIGGGADDDVLFGGSGADVLDGGAETDACNDVGTDTTRRNCEDFPEQVNADLNMETLTVVTAQEDGFFSDGDEPYVAVIEWRAVPGEAGSTSTRYKGGLEELSDGAFDGEVLPIPASMGSSDFDAVQMVANLGDVTSGESPELVGTVMIAMESDATPWNLVDNIMLDVQAAINAEVAAVVESIDLTDVADSAALASDLAAGIEQIQIEASQALGEAIGIWFASLSDPDDLIGISFEAWVGANGTLGTELETPLLNALTPIGTVGGVLRDNETRQVTFSGDDAVYQVDLRTNFE